MKLNQLRDNQGARKTRKRLGRGEGSGLGKTCARGQKGQKSRTGVSIKGFEGGQNPLHMRLPKRGFSNAAFRREISSFNLGQLQEAIDAKKIDVKKPVTRKVLEDIGFVRKQSEGVKLLAKGELKVPLEIEVTAVSQAAKKSIEKLKGKLINIGASS